MRFCETDRGQHCERQESEWHQAHFYSVELLIQELKILYQFKIWNSESESMFILVKEGSDVLHRLKVGHTFKSKYYSTDSMCPTIDLETRIKHIDRDDQGRFKGYYLIGLTIINNNLSQTIH